MKIAISPYSLTKIKNLLHSKSRDVKNLRNKFTDAKKALTEIFFYKRKYTAPTISNPKKYIFTENLNYFTTGNKSIWGRGDLDTLNYLNSLSLSLSLKGTWLNVCAGDGRYNNILLKTADKVIASDIDKSALSKLWYLTPLKLRNNFTMKQFNIVNKFPFPDRFFNGVFCTGVLHLFPRKILLERIFAEFERVAKKRGRIIFDFATDVKRVYPNGKLHLGYGNEPQYKFDEALEFVKNYFSAYKINIIESSVHDDLTKTPNLGYVFSCRYFLVDIRKV